MMYLRRRAVRRSTLAAFALMLGLAVGADLPSEAAVEAAVPVTSVKGSACGYIVNIGLFGGPQHLHGCGQSADKPAAAASPEVALPADGSGSATPIAETDADGALAMLGPGAVFGGIWPLNVNDGPPSGPISVSTQGTPAGGVVTSSVDITLHASPQPVRCYREPVGTANCWAPGGFGPSPVEGDSLHAECSASMAGVTGSTRFVNAVHTMSTNSDGEPVEFEPVPDNPPVNYTRHGKLNNIGDLFTVVYNEHVWHPDGSLTVNAAHMYLHGTIAVGEVIKGQVTCGTTPHAATPGDVEGPTCRPAARWETVPRTEFVGVHDSGGIVSISNIQVTNGTVQVGIDPNSEHDYLRFVPGQRGPLGVLATRTDASRPMVWSFDATDAAGNTSRCTGPAQTAPVAGDDAYRMLEDSVLTVPAPGVLGNDRDVDTDPLTAESASPPAHGTVSLNGDGSFTYTPNVGFSGTDTFTYVVSDGQGGTATGTVSVTVSNHAPVANPDAYSTGQATVLRVAAPGVLGNDTDVDGNPLAAFSPSTPGHGTVTLNVTGAFVYTPNAGFTGTDSFTYLVSDGQGATATGTVTISVGVANSAPVAVDDAYTTAEDAPLTVAAPGVVGNDTDANGNALTAGSASTPANGTVVLNPDGSFVYTPDPNFNGTDTFTYVVSDGQGGTDTGTVTVTVTAPDGSAFRPLTPTRILDSRAPNQVGPYATPWGPGPHRDVTVTGAGVPAGADAVVLNVTVTDTAGAGFLTIWPAGQAQPNASSLNWAPGQTIPNAVTVKVGAGGKVSVASPVATAHVIFDVVGYYDGTPGDGYTSLTPSRVLDTRVPPTQGPWGPGETRDVTVAGVGGVPAGADAVVLNVTVTGPTAPGYLTIWPAGQAQPVASSLNWAPGQTIPNAVTVKVGAGGKVSVFNESGSVHVIVDVVGSFSPGTGDLFHPLPPSRVIESRPGPSQVGPYTTPWGPGTARGVQLSGYGGIPTAAAAALLNVTVTGPDATSFLTIWPAGQAEPNASSLNWTPGQTIANSVTTKLNATGGISVKNAFGNVYVIIDAAGWYG